MQISWGGASSRFSDKVVSKKGDADPNILQYAKILGTSHHSFRSLQIAAGCVAVYAPIPHPRLHWQLLGLGLGFRAEGFE